MKVRIECTEEEFDRMYKRGACIGNIVNVACPDGLSCKECFIKFADLTFTDGGEADGGSGSAE